MVLSLPNQCPPKFSPPHFFILALITKEEEGGGGGGIQKSRRTEFSIFTTRPKVLDEGYLWVRYFDSLHSPVRRGGITYCKALFLFMTQVIAELRLSPSNYNVVHVKDPQEEEEEEAMMMTTRMIIIQE